MATESLEDRVKMLEQKLARMAGVVRTRRFELVVDEKDKPRAGLRMFRGVPWLWLADEKGERRAGLIVRKDGPCLYLYDEKGMPRATLAVLKDGPGLGVYDEKGKRIWRTP